jgi:TctA family transporter
MRKPFTALAAIAVILVTGSLVGKPGATTVTGVATLLPLTKNLSPVANVACWCGQYQCACRGPVRSAVRGTTKATATVGRGVVKGTAIAGRGVVVGTGRATAGVARGTATAARGTGRGAWCILTLGHCGSPVPPGY